MSFPLQPILLLADSQLLFWRDQDGPFLQFLKEGIEKKHLKAAYIGASNGDNPEFFSIFKGAMDLIGVEDCRMIYAQYNEPDQEFLKEADLILLAGGDVALGWTAISETGMQQDIIQRYYGGAALIGISAGAVQLGLGARAPKTEDDLLDTFKLIPFYLDVHDEHNQWQSLKELLKVPETAAKGLGIPKGGGLIYHPDHTLEPVKQPLVEFSKPEEEWVQTLLLPPQKDDPESNDDPGQEMVARET